MPKTADAVQDRVRELGAQIATAHQTAQQAWTKFDATRKAVVEDPAAASDPNSEAFKAAEAASTAYDEARHSLEGLREARDKLLELAAPASPATTTSAATGPPGSPSATRCSRNCARWPAGARCSPRTTRTLKQRGAFNVTGRKSVEAVLIRRAAEVLDEDTGEMLNPSRDALREAIRSGDSAAWPRS
jgi:hypothetical protein